MWFTKWKWGNHDFCFCQLNRFDSKTYQLKTLGHCFPSGEPKHVYASGFHRSNIDLTYALEIAIPRQLLWNRSYYLGHPLTSSSGTIAVRANFRAFASWIHCSSRSGSAESARTAVICREFSATIATDALYVCRCLICWWSRSPRPAVQHQNARIQSETNEAVSPFYNPQETTIHNFEST